MTSYPLIFFCVLDFQLTKSVAD